MEKFTLSNRSYKKHGQSEVYQNSILGRYETYKEANAEARRTIDEAKAESLLFIQAWREDGTLKAEYVYRVKSKFRKEMDDLHHRLGLD